MDFNDLTKYTKVDKEKLALMESAFPRNESKAFYSMGEHDAEEYCLRKIDYGERISKICPECGKKYPQHEIFCLKCLVKLKEIEKTDIMALDVSHEFICEGSNSYSDFAEILTSENLVKINDFDFARKDFNAIIRNIKSSAIESMDSAVKENKIDLDSLTIAEKVILFAKSFVDVEFKSYGQELGFYSFNTIFVDDRQLEALQITTVLHELTHFLIKEILTQTLCKLLDSSKTSEMESIITFILTYSKENCLIDEYAAHTVEGRFTLFGYQDYSSFLNVEKEIDLSPDDIEMLKTIGNTLAHMIKTIVESFIDDELLKDIKRQFRKDIMDSPDYSQLKHENCTLLTYEGFFRAIQFILLDGFAVASENLEKLNQINDMWQDEKQ